MTTATAPIAQIPTAWLAFLAVVAVLLMAGYVVDHIAREVVRRHVNAALEEPMKHRADAPPVTGDHPNTTDRPHRFRSLDERAELRSLVGSLSVVDAAYVMAEQFSADVEEYVRERASHE